jgi:hypothetical protein
LDEGQEGSALELFALPNPSRGAFTVVVDGNDNQPVDLMVTDMLGRRVYAQLTQAKDVVQFGQNFAKGIYILQAVQGGERKNLRLMKE